MLTLIRQSPIPLKLALLATLVHIAVTVALLGQPERPDALFNGLYDTVIIASTLTCLLAWRHAPAHLRRGLGNCRFSAEPGSLRYRGTLAGPKVPSHQSSRSS